jgi:hypothetical protein
MNNPLLLLEQEYLKPEHLQVIEEGVRGIPDLPEVVSLGDLETPTYGEDPSELIKSRYLYKKGILLMVGPTGIGKSSFAMQFMIHLAIGKPLFGMVPGEIYQRQGMRILYIQAENDSYDLAECRNGIFMGCEDLTPDEVRKANENILTVTITDRTGQDFADTLEALVLAHGPFDMVVVDPAFSYLGGESNSNKDVGQFLRNGITPVLHRHNLGMIILHHSNKPLRGKEKDGWSGGDFAYLGAGAAEWANTARAVLAIRSVGSESIFILSAAKRGRRLGWKDNSDIITYSQYISHHSDPNIICWRPATDEEILEVTTSTKPGRRSKVDVTELLYCVSKYPGNNQSWYGRYAGSKMGCTSTTLQTALLGLKCGKLIDEKKVGRSKTYQVSDQGAEKLEGYLPRMNWDHLPTEGK